MEQIIVRLSKEQKENLKRKAHESYMTVSEFVRTKALDLDNSK